MARTSLETRQRITELRERNWSKASIAEQLGVSIGTVSHWCLVEGAEPKKLPPMMPRRSGPIVRAGKMIHPFTADDDALLLALSCQGFGYSLVARQLTTRDPSRPRNPATVKYRLLTIARREERYGVSANG